MIVFKTIKYKNFLSSGNAFTKLVLDKNPTTLVVGENGSGKSTMLDAICFSLFGRPFRNINKPQLLNSINKKNCVVEIEFVIGGKEYRIVRGIKPTLFEIYVNGKLLNQDAAARDYQKYLEDVILKLNYKSFTQIVILGSASFTPFMQLPLGFRRNIIEDILDIQIFTSMNNLLKQKQVEAKEKMTNIETTLTLALHKAKIQQEYIKSLQNDRQTRIHELTEKITDTRNAISQQEDENSGWEQSRENLQNSVLDYDEVRAARRELVKKYEKVVAELDQLEEDVAFYHNTNECPTCKQGLHSEFKEKVIAEKGLRTSTVRGLIQEFKNKNDELESRLEEIQKIQKKISELGDRIVRGQSDIISNERYIQVLEVEIHELSGKVGNIEAEKTKLKALAKEGLQAETEKAELGEEKYYYDIAASLLKDTGIKTKIIRQYLPAINKLVNRFLQAMDFFVHFELDEQFNEVIRSRHRDEFSYASFSEGEKQRIDLALVFTWRTIAKMKNSASTNLLLLDEVFDGSLDTTGTEYVMTLLNTLGEQTNVWVISHKGDQLFDKFSNVIRFVKKRNFSTIQT